jgi:hypothetical protein
LPESVRDALRTWLAVHDELAPGAIEGLYVVGSVALDDWTTRSDIDVVAVVADPSEPELADALAAAHERVRARVEVAVDGPYVAWGDLVVPAMAVQRPWVLDGAFHVDGESFEINPVTWFALARYGVALRGAEPATIGVATDLAERRAWVAENVRTYWSGVGERLAAGVAETDEATFGGEVLEWVALGVSRMLFTFETGDVTSKSGAGRWAIRRAPDYARMLERAVEVRAEPGEVTRDELLLAADFVARVVATVR